VVQGYKLVRSDAWYRTIIGRLYHHCARLAFGLSIRDVDCDFRLLRREVFDRIKLESTSGFICTELMKQVQTAGFRVVERPVHHYPRVFGHSMFFTPKVLRILPVFLRAWWKLILCPALARLPRPGRRSLPLMRKAL